MKVQVSARLDAELVRFLEEYQRDHERASRSEALEDAIEALRDRVLEHEYSRAMDEWLEADDATAWERTSRDGIDS
jgi:Arc/MetJ-type ribon-helix-helix transcriptional regulator